MIYFYKFKYLNIFTFISIKFYYNAEVLRFLTKELVDVKF